MGECPRRPLVKISVIGAGNVATHLARALHASPLCEVVEICSPRSAARLAAELNVKATASLADVAPDSNLYLISVSDDALPQVVDGLPRNPQAVYAHTSGSVGMEVLSPLSPKIGVFYPLQTFSRDVEVDIARVPMFIEGSDDAVSRLLTTLAESISGSVFKADSRLRGQLHVAAVFACNFVNHLWAIADSLLARDGLTLEVLHPLLEETLRKAERNHPADVQTGPAARGDVKIIEKHASSLPADLAALYRDLSKSIMNSKI